MIIINLSPKCENILVFDGVSSAKSCFPNSNTRIRPSQYKIKQPSQKYGSNQIKLQLNLKNNSYHNSVWLNPLLRCLASHCQKIKQIKKGKA